MRINVKIVPMPGAEIVIPEVQTMYSACADVPACLNHVTHIKVWNSANTPFEKKIDRSRPGDAWFCLYPNERALIPTGMKFIIPHGFQVKIIPRSGLALKSGITLLNSPGTIDSDYTNEVMVILHNTSDNHFYIRQGDRIAQMEIRENTMQHMFFNFGTEEELQEHKESSNREGGFGSTGI